MLEIERVLMLAWDRCGNEAARITESVKKRTKMFLCWLLSHAICCVMTGDSYTSLCHMACIQQAYPCSSPHLSFGFFWSCRK